jgi:hypothetical protein
MRILFDQGTPAPLRQLLAGHQVITAFELGWSTLKNGDLLGAAEQEGFDLFITTDRNLQYQQNLASRRIAIMVLSTTSWPRIRKAADQVRKAVDACAQAAFVELPIP